MLSKNKLSLILLFIIASCITIGCDTVHNVYRSSPSKKNYWTIKAVTLSHCGCTELYVQHLNDKRVDFELLYTDKIARKTLFKYGSDNKIFSVSDFYATKDSFTIPFDSLDIEMFKQIDSVLINKKGIIYELSRREYNGYVIK